MEQLNRLYKMVYGSFDNIRGSSRRNSKDDSENVSTMNTKLKSDIKESALSKNKYITVSHISASTSNLDNIQKTKGKFKFFGKTKTTSTTIENSGNEVSQESQPKKEVGSKSNIKSIKHVPGNNLRRQQSSSMANISIISSPSSPPSLLSVEKSRPQQYHQRQHPMVVSTSTDHDEEPFSSLYEPRGIEYPANLTSYQTPSKVDSTKELIEVLILNLQILERKNEFLEGRYLDLERKHQLLAGRLERKTKRLRETRAEVWTCLICGQNWAQLAQMNIDCYSLRCGHIFCYRCCMRHAGRCVRCRDIFVVDKKVYF